MNIGGASYAVDDTRAKNLSIVHVKEHRWRENAGVERLVLNPQDLKASSLWEKSTVVVDIIPVVSLGLRFSFARHDERTHTRNGREEVPRV